MTFRRVLDAEMQEATQMGVTLKTKGRVINIHCFVQVVIVHILVVYTTFTREWYNVFHRVSKHMHVMWYTCSDL